jgi:hypothetical protein
MAMHTACHHCMMHRCVKQTNESMHASHTDSLVLCNLCHALRTQEHRQRHCMTVATLPSLQSVKVNEPTRELLNACTHAHTHCCCVIFITALMDLRLSRDNPCRMNKHLIISSWWSKSWVEQLRGLLPSRPATNAHPHTAPRSVKR